MIQFFGSNIKCFEYLKSCTLNVLRCHSHTGELFYYQWPGFHYTLLFIYTFWVCYFYFVDKFPWNLKWNSISSSQNDQKKLEIGKMYDRSSGKYVWSCLMIFTRNIQWSITGTHENFPSTFGLSKNMNIAM